MYVLTEITASKTSAFVGNVHVSNDVKELQNVMDADFEYDLKEADNFWKDCGSHINDKPMYIRDSYYAKIKTPTELKSWSIVEVPGEVTQP